MGFDDGVGRAKAQPMSVATRHMLRKYMCVMLCAAVLVSTATAALAWTFGAALSHDPHMTHKNSASLPKIGQHSLSKGAGAGTRSGVHSRGAHGRARTSATHDAGVPRGGAGVVHAHTRGGTDSLAAAAASDFAGAGSHGPRGGAGHLVSSLPGVSMLKDARACGSHMGAIHQCVRSKRKDCNAIAWANCLHRAGLEADAYTAVVSGRDGLFLLNVNDMYIGASLLLYGEWSHSEVDLMALNLKADSTVLDVGANIGAMTVPLARRVSQGRVLAFEPQRIVSQILAANVQLNGLRNVDVRRAGAGTGKTAHIDVPEMDPLRVNNFGGLSLVQKNERNKNEGLAPAPVDS